MVVGFLSPVLRRKIMETNIDPTGNLWIVLWNEDVKKFKTLLNYLYDLPVLQQNFVSLFQMAVKYEVRHLNNCILETNQLSIQPRYIE